MPHSDANAARRVAVIGGGITGLAAAHRLVELDPACRVTLFEAEDRLGGLLQTERREGYLLERSADSFITDVPWALDLCRRVGLEDHLVATEPVRRRALVVRGGRLHPVPEGLMLMAPQRVWPLVASPLLSPSGKLRMLGEYLVPQRSDSIEDESLAAFARRRLGREAFERLVEPLVAGIYTADPERLSMAAALPRFWEMEARHGSLLRAAFRQRAGASPSSAPAGTRADDSTSLPAAGARYGLFVAPGEGMGSLVSTLAGRLATGVVELRASVERLDRRQGKGWHVWLAGHAAPREFDAVVVSLSAKRAAMLVRAVDPLLADELAGIDYASSAVVLLGYRREQIADPLEGFGFVVPRAERRGILACSFASNKFPGRAPPGRVLLRVFAGGAQHPHLVDLDDRELERLVCRELEELLGMRGEPELRTVCRWPASMPQYHVGHLARVARIETRLAALPDLALAGNAYRGVGIPHCIHSGEQAAVRISAASHDTSGRRSVASDKPG